MTIECGVAGDPRTTTVECRRQDGEKITSQPRIRPTTTSSVPSRTSLRLERIVCPMLDATSASRWKIHLGRAQRPARNSYSGTVFLSNNFSLNWFLKSNVVRKYVSKNKSDTARAGHHTHQTDFRVIAWDCADLLRMGNEKTNYGEKQWKQNGEMSQKGEKSIPLWLFDSFSANVKTIFQVIRYQFSFFHHHLYKYLYIYE